MIFFICFKSWFGLIQYTFSVCLFFKQKDDFQSYAFGFYWFLKASSYLHTFVNKNFSFGGVFVFLIITTNTENSFSFLFLKVPYHDLKIFFFGFLLSTFYWNSHDILWIFILNRITCSCIIIVKNYDLLKKKLWFYDHLNLKKKIWNTCSCLWKVALESHKSFDMLLLSFVIWYQDLFYMKASICSISSTCINFLFIHVHTYMYKSLFM